MNKGIFVTATGTDVGKTYVTGLLIKQLRNMGMNVGYYKAALSGAEITSEGLIPGDAAFVNRVANLGENPMDLVSYIYENQVSPHLAAQIEGNPLEMSVVKEHFNELGKRYDYMVVEGSGGIVCPIRYDDEKKIFLEDIIQELALDTILVADAGLGTINSVLLTAEYMKQKGILIRGIVLNHYDSECIMHQDNKKMIQAMTQIPILATVAKNANKLEVDNAMLSNLFI